MRRTFFLAAIGATSLGAALLPAPAAATILALGNQTPTPLAAPTCPSSGPCKIVLTRVTALVTVVDGRSYPTTVKQAGRLVAFTVGLSNLSSKTTTRKKDIDYLNATYGGDAQVQLSVLQPIGKPGLHKWKVVAASPIFHVVQYLGTVAQIPLLASIEVKPGQTIALTTPTWVPVLGVNMPKTKFVYRQSRAPKANCNVPSYSDQAQMLGHTGTYGCKYYSTRPEYGATEITYPVASNAVH